MPSILKHIPSLKNLFKPIPVKQDKVNKAFTNNYFLLSQSLSISQNRLFKYILSKVNTIGYIHINYSLIDDYREVLKFTSHNTLQSKKTVSNASRKKVVEDIIFLIEVGAIVRILRNSGHFMLNPCYVFTKANTTRETIPLKYAEEWKKIVEIGVIDEDFGLRYYLEMAKNKIIKTPANTSRAVYQGDDFYKMVSKPYKSTLC